MGDWVKTLSEGYDLLKTFHTTPQNQSLSLSSSMPVRQRLFHDLHLLDQVIGGTKMLFNFQVAAIHMAFLLDGHSGPGAVVSGTLVFVDWVEMSLTDHGQALPDMPKDLQELQNA